MNTGKVIVLSGGVGGAKLVLGLSHVVPPNRLLVVTNTGDDFDHLGLRVCPDTDTVLYTLAGLSNTELGWGRANESWHFMQTVGELGGPTWFNLGDADLALNVLRTKALSDGQSLTQWIASIAKSMGIGAQIVPMSDQVVETRVNTPHGQLAFQEYFVRDRCAPIVTGFEFAGIEQATPNPVLLKALDDKPEAIVIAPSNPYISVDPILSVPGLREALRNCGAPIVGVSPIVGGRAIKGPAAKMMGELGVRSDVTAIAEHYGNFIDGLVIDHEDKEHADTIRAAGTPVKVDQTIMNSLDDRIILARSTLAFAQQLTMREPSLLSQSET